jgi:hypothetical protein
MDVLRQKKNEIQKKSITSITMACKPLKQRELQNERYSEGMIDFFRIVQN